MLKAEVSPFIENNESSVFSSQQLYWLGKAKAFAEAIPLEDIINADTQNVFRRDLFEAACQEGFGDLPFPTTYGGSGGDYVSFCLVNEEFARCCVPIMSSLGVHVLCQEPIYRFGTPEQKDRYLPLSSSGKYLAAFGLTEPGAGSDTAAISTTARLIGGEYVLNGTKTFITSGGVADYYIVMARLAGFDGLVDSDARSITAFIVERGFPGFEIGQKFDMLGMRGYSTCELVFNDCRVPKDNLLGQPGWGRKVALSSLGKGRVTIAAQATGWAQGALDCILRHLRQGHAEGHLDPAMGGLASLVGELAILVEAARVLTHQAARKIDNGDTDVVLAGMAKVQATDTAMTVATEAVSIIGPHGINPQLLVERIFRDAKAGQIYEGTNQIQRMLIARHLLQ
ncbi:MAG: acyl-CoA dehydrogenase family protein [Candidatus Melainabacteria bacterium]|nr:acyl-CoA dehydrogenase family protein [Candidatus Melainabacteria bacterium]